MEQIQANKVRDLARRFEEWEREQQRAAQNAPVTTTIDPNQTYNPPRKKGAQNINTAADSPKQPEKLNQPDDGQTEEEEAEVGEDQEEEEEAEAEAEEEEEVEAEEEEEVEAEEEEVEAEEEEEEEESEAQKEDSPFEDEGEAPEEEAAPSKATDSEQPNDDPLAQYRLSDALIEEGSRDLSLPVEHLRTLGRGVKGYAFVRENSGMLKPITIFFHPNSEKLLIIRQKEAGRVNVLYVKVNTLKEVDHTLDAMNYLVRNSEDALLIKTVEDIKTMPHCVIWTNAQFEKTAGGAREMGRFNSIKRRIFGKAANIPKRSIVIILEDPAGIDSILRLIAATAKRSGLKELNIKPAIT